MHPTKSVMLLKLFSTFLLVWTSGIQNVKLTYFGILKSICLGEQSFKHADVLSEKINFSAPGGPKSAIFDTDDVDSLYYCFGPTRSPMYV